VAVLPFDNLGRDSAFDYLGDGMANDLRGGLMSLAGLTVKARTSSEAARGKPVKEAGALLGVGVVLQGAFRHAADRTTVTVDLVNVGDESALWTGNFVLPADGNFSSAQDSITSAVASALRLTRAGGAANAEGQRGTADAEAYNLYLKGQFLFARRGADNLYRAIDAFKAAIARDSTFARAQAGLAMVYTILPAYATLTGDSLLREAERISRRAIALDSTLVDGHIALANALGIQRRTSEGEAEYAVAVRLDPRNATAHQWRGANLNVMARSEEAIRENRLAVELDPLSAVALNDLGYTLVSSGRFQDALDATRREHELDPSFLYAFVYKGMAFASLQQPDSAARAFDAGFRQDSTAPGVRAYQAWSHALMGRRDAAERELGIIERTPTPARDFEVAIASLALGRTDAALDALERASRAHSYYLTTTAAGCDPTFSALKGNPRFIALVKDLGQGMCPTSARWPVPGDTR
jgi:serine/threonine-protein kinase